jgi:hypothetical protein
MMFTNRFTKIVVAIIVVAFALVSASMIPAGSTSVSVVESKEQSLREYRLGERYGVLPEQNAWLIAEQKIQREYILGERYGVTTQEYASDQGASDFYQQHPDWMWAINDQNVVIPLTGDAAFPDYHQRHPELSVRVEASVDTTDYYFRHP